MLTTSTTMETALSQHEIGTNSFDLLEVVEVYANDYVPDVTNGYEPDDAEKRWGGILGYTFLTLAYEREYIDRGDIQKFFDKKENSCTLNFSNISRSMSQWVQTNEIEGKQAIIRVLARTSTVLADSVVIFTGRLDKPGDFEDGTGSLTITQRFGQINQQFPPRTFGPNDPTGRASNDILFEGFRFTQQQATVLWTTRERRQGFGGLVGLTKKVTHSFQASSHTGVSSEIAVPDSFGRVQIFGTYLASLDVGGAINVSVAVGEGVIADYENIRQTNPQFSQISSGPAKFYGYKGGEGPVGREQKPIRILNPAVPNHPGDGYYSRTAWFGGFVTGSTIEVDEAEAPDWMILVKAKIIKVPDGSGIFNTEAWSDSPAYVARYLIANERYFNEGEDAIEDSACYATGLHCAETILDSTRGEWTYVPQADAALHGTSFSLYRSTGLVDSRRVRMSEFEDLAGDPVFTLAEIEPFDPGDPPEPFDPPTNPNLRPTLLRVRYTCNVTLVERMSGLDFLYNVIAPTGRLFFRRNGKGRIEIHSEKPADNTRLRTSSTVGATTVAVTDIEPWKAGALLTQKLLIGNTLTSSEARRVTAANYTADGNSITLSSSGSGLTATASGANLAGGSSSVAASGTVTLSGTPNAGDSITATINGLACTYVLDSFDTLNSAANLLAKYINATPRLNQFVKATASGAVVTITSKWGVLTLNSALANTHAAQVASPLTAPTLAGASGGVLPAGTWYVGFAYRTAIGPTALSPVQSVVLTADQKINVTGLGALPAGVLSVDWYVSKYAGSTELVFWANNNGSAFSIGTTLPSSSNVLPPDANESGEEILRVAMSFSSNDQGAAVLAQTGLTKGNIHAGSYKWPLFGRQSSTNLTTGRFFDATDDYAATPLEVHDYAHQQQIRKVNKKEYDLSGFDNYSQSSRYLNFQLSRNREGDWFNSLSAGPYGMLLEEGDIFCASSDNGGLINVVTRAEEISIGPAPTFTTKIIGRKYSTLMFSDRVRQHNITLPTVLRSLTPVPTLIEFIDTVAIREADKTRSGFFVSPSFDATVQGSWRGFSLWADFGDGYVKVASGDAPSSTGVSTDTLAAADTSVLDTTGDLTFTLKYVPSPVPFVTCTEADLIANPYRNLFLVGDEYIQAATIVDNGNRSFTISDLLHGRFDTDCVSHSIGERVVYVDGSEVFVPTDPSRIGIEYDYKAVTTNQDVADATAIPFTWNGNIFKEAKPTNLTAVIDPSLNWHLRMTGHPKDSDIPGSYIFRVRRFSDGVLMRDIPVVDNMGTSFAAIFPDYFSGDAGAFESGRIVNNNVYPGATGTSDHKITYARSAQEITEPGAFAECTFVDVSLTDAVFARLCLLESSFTPWESTGAGSSGFYAVEIQRSAGLDPIATLTVHEADASGLLTAIGAPVDVYLPAKVRITLVGTQVRFYVDWVNANSIPIARGTFPLRFPLKLKAVVFANTGIENIKVGGLADPQTIYSTAQQTQDNEDNGGTGPLNDITVEGWQVSPLVFPDQKGVSTPVTRFFY